MTRKIHWLDVMSFQRAKKGVRFPGVWEGSGGRTSHWGPFPEGREPRLAFFERPDD